MAINFPSDLYSRGETWRQEANSQTFSSELTGTEQVATLPGSRWRCTLPFINLTRDKGRQLNAFLMALRGRAGEALIIPFDARTALGSPGGSPTVAGANQTGGTLTTDGWSASTTVLKAGDFFSVNGELKVCTADVVSNGSGQATIEFSPDLHKAPNNNDPIVYTNPACTMRLVNDTQAAWQLTLERTYMITLEFVEVLV